MHTHPWRMIPLAAACLLIGCAPPASPTAPPTPTSPGPAASPMPAFTPTPAATSDVPLSATGPWLALEMKDDLSLWAMNPDGTGLRRLIDDEVHYTRVRPGSTISGGLMIAYGSSVVTEGNNWGESLKVITLPGGQPVTIEPGQAHGVGVWSPDGSQLAFITEARSGSPEQTVNLASPPGWQPRKIATIRYDNDPQWEVMVHWSPDSSRIAYRSGIGPGKTAVFVYDLPSGKTAQVTGRVTDDHPADLTWSPDGRQLIASTGYDLMVAQPDGSAEPRQLLSSAGTSVELALRGWQSPDEMLVTTLDRAAQQVSVRRIDIKTGDSHTLAAGEFGAYGHGTDWSEEHNTWLLAANPSKSQSPLVMVKDDRQTEIANPGIVSVWWYPMYDLFLGIDIAGKWYTITLDWQVDQLPILAIEGADTQYPAWPEPSPDGALWLWHAQHPGDISSRVGDAFKEPGITIRAADIPGVASIYTWSPGAGRAGDSRRLFIFTTDGDMCIAAGPDFKPDCSVLAGSHVHFKDWLN